MSSVSSELIGLAGNRPLMSVNLSMDVRTAIHGLEVWPV